VLQAPCQAALLATPRPTASSPGDGTDNGKTHVLGSTLQSQPLVSGAWQGVLHSRWINSCVLLWDGLRGMALRQGLHHLHTTQHAGHSEGSVRYSTQLAGTSRSVPLLVNTINA
jgi:hypothetical protein